MKTFDTRANDLSRSHDQIDARHEVLPWRLQVLHGKLALRDELRLVLLGTLIGHVGTAEAVKLGPFFAWKATQVLQESNLGEQ